MFRGEGPGRSDRHNRFVAGYLALAGGFSNSAGFVVIGAFTSHVTGNVGRFAHDLAVRDVDAAGAAFAMIGAFFVGALLASMVIESNALRSTANGYGVALLGEAALLAAFVAVARSTVAPSARGLDLEAALLCAAMGVQNSLVTRLSGAVVRTTHLTGVVTDLGIESARWLRWWWKALSTASEVRLAVGTDAAERPAVPKLALLGTIAGAFTLGAIAGAALALRVRELALVAPCIAVAAIGVYALWNGAGTKTIDAATVGARK